MKAIADGYRVRLLRPEDEAELRAIHARQVKFTGFDYAWPDLAGDARYYRVFVLERLAAAGGGAGAAVVEGCLVAHATTEVFVIADRPRLLRALMRRRAELEAMMRAAGADELHAFVPRAMLGRMRHFLQRMGFRPSSARCATFYRSLERAEANSNQGGPDGPSRQTTV